jgi:SRSO17 transposase
MGHSDPLSMQRLMYEAKWDADVVVQRVRTKAVARLGYQPGVGVLDESGFVKRGDKSAGVGRQYCGRLGKVENCQVGVFLGYIAPLGYALLDRELYLPKDWCEDTVRRAEAKIPLDVTFQTKPQLARQMLARAWAEGIPMQWVVADTTYGNCPELRNFIHNEQRCYVMEVPQTLHIRQSGEPEAQTVKTLAASLEPGAWRRLAFNFGEKGLTFYDWAAIRVTPTTDAVGEQWLLLRRNIDNGEITYYLSNAAIETLLETLAEIASSRWRMEQMLEEAKGEAGLAEYEVRHYPSWYRHMTLSLAAHTWLTLVRLDEREKKPFACVADLQSGRTPLPAEYAMADATFDDGLQIEMVGLATAEALACHRLPLSGWSSG